MINKEEDKRIDFLVKKLEQVRLVEKKILAELRPLIYKIEKIK